MSSSSSTRKRTSPQALQNRSVSSVSDKSRPVNPDDLPPSRTSDSLRAVSAPLSSTRLSNLIYLLIGLTTLLCAFYTYRVFQYKREVGGWWSLALGRPQDAYMVQEGTSARKKSRKGSERGHEVEDRINALAEALGMPSKELASAIAGAVRAYVPPASLSSVAARETGEAVNMLLKEPESGTEDAATKAHEQRRAGEGVVEGIRRGVESFAGMDEPY
ncbi:hypothetical protein HYPSUDRAFT_41609 [Hypholoma sublateritium FD-334 SS-4]|uniref:Uncharacterized protein n=1 Tax=Hypholoma sublateritium (strain FD-334 SS-4) TaxID=945553 RepID=A0A0D2PPG1_HYPSF|nr:hypothetical protein HYPSUDRAFT_41609 [Hypholoma sublateritium FD-334 SS-4]